MHAYANPTRFLAIARPLTPWLLGLGTVLLLAGAWAGLAVVPGEAKQGETARILYVHVPAAWLGMGGWTALAVSGLVQLVWRHPLAGIAARAIAVPGMLFTALCLATGSIWGKPTWGTWWEWDGRMTSMLVLLFLYAGFIALTMGDAGGNGGQRQGGSLSRGAAVYALVGAINIPIINRSVVWWNSLHQGPSITVRGSSIDGALLWPLGLTLLGFSFLFGAIVLMRMRRIIADNRVAARLRRLADDEGSGV
ncbi:MAG: heme ABC transporter permease CcmC [Sphingopyxis granuli]|jgi:heme exporter protein C|uniref:heme ABC transporter permease CcmC n=1 Tax=Sphingopyxis granuli TaxID=267128 RepID=UPI001BB05FB9|nr:heme ABC transporter permease CcmC [Sphingopyxis granuli]QUM71572.1 cytochrome c biogenesis protein CcsA [Sphingopyxis granuli]